MRFGDYIRDRRRELEWTQPDAAEKIGIEQSYLSKLESGKSYPSEDVFAALKATYKIDMDDLNAKLFSGELDQLGNIAEVREAITARKEADRKRTLLFLTVGTLALALGGASLGLSRLAEDTFAVEYHYRSEGVIKAGETLDAFDIAFQGPLTNRPNAEALIQRQQDMIARVDQRFRVLDHDRGSSFVEDVENGKRFWREYEQSAVETASPLRWFIIPALALFFGGLGCFISSFRLRLK